jgi:hypothetical protein
MKIKRKFNRASYFFQTLFNNDVFSKWLCSSMVCRGIEAAGKKEVSEMIISFVKWDFLLSWWQIWRWLSSGMFCHKVWQKLADISEVLARSIYLMVKAVGSCMLLWNNGQFLPEYRPRHPKKLSSLCEVGWANRQRIKVLSKEPLNV